MDIWLATGVGMPRGRSNALGRGVVKASEDFTAADGTAITALALPWTKHGSATNTAAPTVIANRVVGENAVNNSLYYRNDWQPASADYLVEADIVMRSDNNIGIASVVARLSTSANTYYQFRYTTNGNAWQLFKVVAGSATQLGSNVVQVLTVDQPYRAGLSLRGSTITAFVDGAEIISAVDAAISAPGRAGIGLIANATATTGVHLDNWQVRQ